MKSCTSRTVLTTLHKLSSISEKVQIRRKFKKGGEGVLQWWFLIRGEEADLLLHNQKWEAIHMQTTWKLEHCYKPITHDQDIGEKDTYFFLGHN